jgi:hypothetical protein
MMLSKTWLLVTASGTYQIKHCPFLPSASGDS